MTASVVPEAVYGVQVTGESSVEYRTVNWSIIWASVSVRGRYAIPAMRRMEPRSSCHHCVGHGDDVMTPMAAYASERMLASILPY